MLCCVPPNFILDTQLKRPAKGRHVSGASPAACLQGSVVWTPASERRPPSPYMPVLQCLRASVPRPAHASPALELPGLLCRAGPRPQRRVQHHHLRSKRLVGKRPASLSNPEILRVEKSPTRAAGNNPRKRGRAPRYPGFPLRDSAMTTQPIRHSPHPWQRLCVQQGGPLLLGTLTTNRAPFSTRREQVDQRPRSFHPTFCPKTTTINEAVSAQGEALIPSPWSSTTGFYWSIGKAIGGARKPLPSRLLRPMRATISPCNATHSPREARPVHP